MKTYTGIRRTLVGYVYVISDPTGKIKIGKSINVDKRLATLQTGNEQQLKILYRLHVKDMRKAETNLHEIFSGGRSRGEWFELSESDTVLLKKIFKVLPTDEKEEQQLKILGLR